MKPVTCNFLMWLLCLAPSFKVSGQVYIRDSTSIPKPADTLFKNPAALNFLMMGDWGRNISFHVQQQKKEQLS